LSEYVQSLARGLAVITTFSAENSRQTLADVARSSGLARATARRLLLTLVELGYARFDGKHFELAPRVLDLGYRYISSLNVADIAQPYLEEFSEGVHESSSVAVLDDTDIVYVARVPTARIMTVSIGLGSRFPAFQTSMGRILLAELADDEIVEIYRRSDRSRVTERTVASPDALLELVAEIRGQGYAVVDQELEVGVRSVAAPLRDASGRAVAAVNVSTHAGRTTMREIDRTFVPRLTATAEKISAALALR